MSEGKSGKDNLKEVSERTAGSILEQAMMSALLLTWTAIERPRTSIGNGDIQYISQVAKCLLVYGPTNGRLGS